MRAIFLVFALVGCSTPNPWKNLTGYPDYNGLSRFENKEVICYNFLKDEYPSMVCKFK